MNAFVIVFTTLILSSCSGFAPPLVRLPAHQRIVTSSKSSSLSALQSNENEQSNSISRAQFLTTSLTTSAALWTTVQPSNALVKGNAPPPKKSASSGEERKCRNVEECQEQAEKAEALRAQQDAERAAANPPKVTASGTKYLDIVEEEGSSTMSSSDKIAKAGDVVEVHYKVLKLGKRSYDGLSGEGTVVDCNGFSVRQKTDSSAAAVDCDVFPTRCNETKILLMKQSCDLYFVWGFKVENGATLKNCNVQQFWGGAEILNGGSVENSQFSLNYRGLQVLNEEDNTQSNVKGGYVKSCILFLCAVLFANADIDFWIGCAYLRTVRSTTMDKLDSLCSRASIMVEQPSILKM